MVSVRVDRAAGSAALLLGVLVALLAGTTLSGTRVTPAPAGEHRVTASAALTAPGTAAVRMAEHLGAGLRLAENHPMPAATTAAAVLLLGPLPLLACVPPGRPVASARGRWSTPPRAPPVAG